MFIQYFVFLLYLLGCFWLFPRLKFVKSSGLNPSNVRILLAIKLISAVVIAWYLSRLQYSDYLGYNVEGSLQYQLLMTDPAAFLTNLGNVAQHSEAKDLFSSSGFWADLRFNLIYKIIALFNLITAGNFYLNSILFSSIVFFGHIGFYKIFIQLYPTNKWLVLAACFLLPSLLMYSSCVHKDGIIFLAMAAMCYIFYSFLNKVQFPRFSHIIIFILAAFTIFMFRNYVLVALLPAMFTALLCRILPLKRGLIVAGSYGIYTALFFLSASVLPSISLPEAVVQRKADFALLEKGSTDLPMNELQPGFTSFVTNIPQAINHTLMRPYLWDSTQPGVIMAALELFSYQVLLILFFLYRQKNRESIDNFNVFGILFFISMMLIIGYTIPNAGAIVRYRSIFWVLLLCPMVCNITWEKLQERWLRKLRT